MIPTKEVIEQYKQDIAAAMAINDDMAQMNALNDAETMAEHYDWRNRIFTDRKTGKQGIRDVEGTVLVPAIYDKVVMTGSYRLFHKRPSIVRQGDKYGLVAMDGTGKPLTPFIYDYLKWDYYSPLCIAMWGGAKKLAGLICEDGQVVLPCCIKKMYQPHNNIVCYEGTRYQGVIDLGTMKATQPIFDSVAIDPEFELVTVIKKGEKGVLTQDTLEFVPMSEYDEDNGEYLTAEIYD